MQWTVNPSPIGLREFESHPAHKNKERSDYIFVACPLKVRTQNKITQTCIG